VALTKKRWTTLSRHALEEQQNSAHRLPQYEDKVLEALPVLLRTTRANAEKCMTARQYFHAQKKRSYRSPLGAAEEQCFPTSERKSLASAPTLP